MSTNAIDLSSLLINGQAANKSGVDVLDADTDIRMAETITGASTVEVSLSDPTRKILRSDLLTARATLVLDDAGFELASVRKTGSALDLTFEDMAVGALRRRKGPKAVPAGAMSRAQFSALLCREVPWIKVLAAAGAPSAVALARGSGTATGTVVSGGGGWGDLTGTVGQAAAALPVVSTTAKTNTLAAEKKEIEDSWTAIGRIMGEIGWRAMARRGLITLAPDAWLLTHAAASYTLSEDDPAVDNIDVDWDAGKPAATASIDLWVGKADLIPGSPVTLTGMGFASGAWLVETIERSPFTKKATVTLIRPQPSYPEPTNTAAGMVGEGGWGPAIPTVNVAGAATLAAGSPAADARVETFVATALAQAGKRYDWGKTGPNTFDCSGLVMWCAARAGGTGSPTSSNRVPYFGRTVGNQLALCRSAGTLLSVEQAISTRGALLIRGPNEHIAISLGNGHTMEARGTAYGVGIFKATGRDWTTGAYVPGITVSVAAGRDGRAH